MWKVDIEVNIAIPQTPIVVQQFHKQFTEVMLTVILIMGFLHYKCFRRSINRNETHVLVPLYAFVNSLHCVHLYIQMILHPV